MAETPRKRIAIFLPNLGGGFERVTVASAGALAAAIDAALAEPARPKAMRDRAVEMAGPAMIHRYSELLTG